MYSGILFDLDGTLVDSAPDLAWCLDQTLSDFGLRECGEARVRQWIGNGVDMLVTRAMTFVTGRVPDAPEIQDLVSRFRCRYQDHYWKRSRSFPGVPDTLKQLAQAGIRMACVTNKPNVFVWPLLESAGLAGYFSTALGTGPGREKKPHPQMAYCALDQLGLNAGNTLFVGDSETDLRTGRNMGMDVWLVSWGYNSGIDVRELGSDRVMDQFDELLYLLG